MGVRQGWKDLTTSSLEALVWTVTLTARDAARQADIEPVRLWYASHNNKVTQNRASKDMYGVGLNPLKTV